VGHASRSSGLLHMDISLAMIFQSSFKTDGDATTCSVYDTITEITSESR
jgi:hypothetical protein